MSRKIVSNEVLEHVLERLRDWVPWVKNVNGGIVQNNKDSLTTTNSGEVALGEYNHSSSDTILSIGIGSSDEERRNAVEIRRDGNIYIISDIKLQSEESLQSILDRKGTTVVSTYDEIVKENKKENIGRFYYLLNDSIYNDTTYVSGLYIISRNLLDDSAIISRIGTTSGVSKEVEERVTVIEDWIKTPISEDDLNEIITNK